MSDITKDLIARYFPYLVWFVIGFIVCLWFRGCNQPFTKSTVTYIDRPVPTIEYIDRWQTDTVRFVSKKVVTKTDTVTLEQIVNRLDTIYEVDTVKIVEAWLTEVAKYDTTIMDGQVRLRWQNYQNLTENLRVDYTPKVVRAKFALGLHGNVGILSDFNTSYTPLFGLGLQATVKKSYFGADYGFNGQHYVGIRVGRNIISR